MAQRFEPGDRVEVYSADRQVCFQIYVRAVNPHTTPVHLIIGVIPIWPQDLDVEPAEDAAPLRYTVRQHQQSFGIFGPDGEVVEYGLTRLQAMDRAAALIAAAELAEKQVAAAEALPPKRGRGRPPKQDKVMPAEGAAIAEAQDQRDARVQYIGGDGN